jgi:hypothetical protein
MSPEDRYDRNIARQELLEAFVSSMGGPACAPMPGTLLEMLEIAAVDRRAWSEGTPEEPTAPAVPLTSLQNRRGITARLLEMGKTVIDVAVRLGRGSDPRRLPV